MNSAPHSSALCAAGKLDRGRARPGTGLCALKQTIPTSPGPAPRKKNNATRRSAVSVERFALSCAEKLDRGRARPGTGGLCALKQTIPASPGPAPRKKNDS
jgi:hypothetical protein